MTCRIIRSDDAVLMHPTAIVTISDQIIRYGRKHICSSEFVKPAHEPGRPFRLVSDAVRRCQIVSDDVRLFRLSLPSLCCASIASRSVGRLRADILHMVSLSRKCAMSSDKDVNHHPRLTPEMTLRGWNGALGFLSWHAQATGDVLTRVPQILLSFGYLPPL